MARTADQQVVAILAVQHIRLVAAVQGIGRRKLWLRKDLDQAIGNLIETDSFRRGRRVVTVNVKLPRYVISRVVQVYGGTPVAPRLGLMA